MLLTQSAAIFAVAFLFALACVALRRRAFDGVS